MLTNVASREIDTPSNQVILSFGKNVKDKKDLIVKRKRFRDYESDLTNHHPQIYKISTPYFVAAHIIGKRNKHNLVGESPRGVIVLDGDKGVIDGEIIDNLAPLPKTVHNALIELGLNHYIYTTWSHGETFTYDGLEQKKIKWRAVIEWRGKDWQNGIRWIVDMLNAKGVGVFAVNEMFNSVIPWFRPSYHPDRKDTIECYSFLDGAPLTQTLDREPKYPMAFANETTNTARPPLKTSKLLSITNSKQINYKASKHDFSAIGNHISTQDFLLLFNNVSGPSHDGWYKFSCPTDKHKNGDRNPSASVRFDTHSGKTFIKCFVGCKPESILQTVGLSWSTLPQADPRTDIRLLNNMSGGFASISHSQKIEAANHIDIMEVNPKDADEILASYNNKASNLEDLLHQYVFVTDAGQYYNRFTGYACSLQAFNTAYANLNLKNKSGCAIKPTTAMERSSNLKVADGRGWLPQPYGKELSLIRDSGTTLANVWKGYALHPCEGNVQPWLDLAEHLIPDKEQLNHFIDRVAFDVQLPNKKPNWHIVFLGVHGAGKEAILTPLCRIFGEAATTIGNTEAKSDFDDGFAKTKVVVYSEVHGLSGDSMEEMKRKSASGASEMYTLNPKGEKKIKQRNLWSLYLVTNNQDAMKFETTERRFYVLECNTAMDTEQTSAYFDNWLSIGGSQHLFDWLLKRDLSHFNANQVPGRTSGFYKMITSTKSDHVILLDECICEGTFGFNEGFVDVQELRVYLKSNGAFCKLATISNWLNKNGFFKSKEQVRKKVNGKINTVSRSIYYRKELLKKSPSELYDFVNTSSKNVVSVQKFTSALNKLNPLHNG